jgi:hypothetical protein
MKKMMDLEGMLSEKKGKKEMSEKEVQAKMEVLQELMEMLQDQQGNSVKSGMDEMSMMSAMPKEMQKVTVAAPDAEGLKEGLEKAEDIMESSPMMASEESEEESNTLSMNDEEDEDSMFAKKKS